MTSKEKLTLSIVIPVYNEQDYIGPCLEAIERQTEKVDEVLLVDNNATDNTIAIARRYPFVKIIKEPLQHQSFAQKRGFDEAKSDIIGRIDADTIIPHDWAANVKAAMADGRVVAVTGDGEPYDMFSRRLSRRGFQFYNWLASLLVGNRVLWGANCALRRSSWLKIRTRVLLREDIWEDHDISYLLGDLGKIKLIRGITVGTSYRAAHKPLPQQVRYQFRSVRTAYLHRGLLRASFWLLLWSPAIISFPLLMIDHFVLKPLAQLAGQRFGPKNYLINR